VTGTAPPANLTPAIDMKRTLFFLPVFCLLSHWAWADATAEIQHLLGYIGGSDCSFVRNGQEHDSAAARDHIENKYDYARRWIETAEQFIAYTATKSSISGELYQVICDGRKEPSAVWLTRELKRFRAAGGH
jgi:hypothetical protein